ncbi:4Fe-4S single cluster domain-containing protein [Actinomadura rubrisoli]|uniref:4Fe-4S single cluster domain-containing protein n=1 Tax=Actinomadura rubrisoli TaxID=2530368 RepID=UPI001A9F0648|nr:4Fe-4S single cluster domain-containing protein [Actinomadura rubrisoli]
MAETCVGTRALGPGRRSVVWVQGCPFRCPGCLAPEWIPDRPARRVAPADLAAELLADPGVTGLTFSGGEPMEQAAGLAEVARLARRDRSGLTVVCFTGYRLERLRDRPPGDGVGALLAEVDVLIDGLYVAARDDDRGLRGSSNQRVHHLTGRLRDAGDALAGGPRKIEIRVRDGAALFVGVPSRALAAAYPPPVTVGEGANARAVPGVQSGGAGASGARAETDGRADTERSAR